MRASLAQGLTERTNALKGGGGGLRVSPMRYEVVHVIPQVLAVGQPSTLALEIGCGQESSTGTTQVAFT